jgi:F-box protein 9
MYTCKRLALIGHTGEQIWRSVCYRAFAHQHYDEGVSCADGSDPDDLEAAATSTFGNSWRRMYYERPRIRFNGVYISTCNYIRQGVSDTWYAPVHMVTYYRYLRFYKDGTCISLLTSSEPADVVPVFNRSVVGSERRQDNTIVYSRDDGTVLTRPKYIINGSWKFQDLDGSLLVETEGSVDRFLFYMKFTIASSGHHRHNKLKWVNFWSVNKLTQNEADFTLRHDKAYYFVRSKY